MKETLERNYLSNVGAAGLLYHVSIPAAALAATISSGWLTIGFHWVWVVLLGIGVMAFPIGALVPGDSFEKFHSAVIVSPIVLFVWATLYSITRIVPISFDDPALQEIGRWLIIIALSSLGAAVALRTVLANRPRTPLLYTAVALCALGISTGLLFALPQTLIRNNDLYVALMAILVVSGLPMLGTVLIGTLEQRHRQIVVGLLAVSAVCTIGGKVLASAISAYQSIGWMPVWSRLGSRLEPHLGSYWELIVLLAIGVMALLAGALVPGNFFKKLYSSVIVFPMALFVWVTLYYFTRVVSLSFDDPVVLDLGRWLVIIALSSLGAAVALRTALANRPRTPLLYAAVALCALAISTGLLFALPQTLIRNNDLYVALMAIVVVPGLSMLGTVLIGTLERRLRQVAVGLLALSAVGTIVARLTLVSVIA